MIQEQHVTTDTNTFQRGTTALSFSRLLTSLLTGIIITCVLTLVEVLVLLLVNPGLMLGKEGNHVTALFALLVQQPLLFLIPLAELIVITAVAFIAMHPLALMAYMRATRATCEKDAQLYLPLLLQMNVQKVNEEQHDGVAGTVTEEVERSLLDLLEDDNASQIILGAAGAGKTMALRVYHYRQSYHSWQHLYRSSRISLFIPLRNYNLFLKRYLASADDATEQTSLRSFLMSSDLPGLRRLRPYLPRLFEQGRLLLLCDGLDEIESSYRARVSRDLVQLMQSTRNRVVIACREIDYREQFELTQAVVSGDTTCISILPLETEQITACVEQYVERQDRHWRHTAGQISQLIERSRLRYLCTNPMMLLTLLSIIDRVGIERGKQLDTRGRLLHDVVHEMIVQEQERPHWKGNAPTEQDVLELLSALACAARWSSDRVAIQLPLSSRMTKAGRARIPELSNLLSGWFDEHPALSPFEDDTESPAIAYENASQTIAFAQAAGLVEVSHTGILSFHHELFADYFVALYCYTSEMGRRGKVPLLRKELLEHVGLWSEPVALWAGLLEDPLPLADRFALAGRTHSTAVLQALVLSLICAGVLWTPPRVEPQRSVTLPVLVAESLTIAVRNKAARDELARIFTRCADEGGQEVYRSLLPLLMVEGIDDLLLLLDKQLVPAMLFAQLQETVDDAAYEAQVRRITKVLGRFGNGVVERAAQLCQAMPGRSVRLRAAAMNILGGTESYRAVEPLITCLSDTDAALVKRAANALAHLGPELTVTRILQTLEQRSFGSVTQSVHQAVLAILEYFLDEQDMQRQLSPTQYQRVIEVMVPVLSTSYQAEPIVQQLARKILVKQGRVTSQMHAVDVPDQRWEKVIELLVRYLPSQDEGAAHHVMLALQEIGFAATPPLLNMLGSAPESVRLRVIEVLRVTRDPRALPLLLQMLGDGSLAMQQEVAKVLYLYAPESIVGLIDLVLNHESEATAESAANILSDIGPDVTEAVTNVLFHIVPNRTRLLVRVLERVHEMASLPALLSLLQMPQTDPLLTITIIRALSKFPDLRVVPPLLTLLSDSRPQIYEETINTLSLLGGVAFVGLVAALDVVNETAITQRVQRALLGMTPFPGEQLIEVLADCTEAQAQHIIAIFKMQGIEAAQIAVKHLLHPDPRVRGYIHQALEAMPGSLVVPPLLEVLQQGPTLRSAASLFLLRYPQAAVAPLVALLGEDERGDVALTLLPQFGVAVLPALLSALEEQRVNARERARAIVVTLVRRSNDPQSVLRAIVQLFNPEPPARAHEALLDVLTKELANESMPALLEGLEDAHLLSDCADALLRLARRPSLQQEVIDRLIRSLYIEERRVGAETALTKIGAIAVLAVGALIIDNDATVAKTARRILRSMGVPALAFIWEAYTSTSNRALREAALEVFHSMPTDVIKDELVMLLSSERHTDIAMAVALLLERMRDEATRQYADRAMVPELLEYVQMHTSEDTNLRIIALLLLLGERALLKPLLDTLEVYPGRHPQLTYMLLFLGAETQQTLLHAFHDERTSPELRTELAASLGMLTAPSVLVDYIRNISMYGLGKDQTNIAYADNLQIALRALGGLLASGQWDVPTLEGLRNAVPEGEPAHELYSILLGMRYEPQMVQMRKELQGIRDTHKRELMAFTERLLEEQEKRRDLEEELERISNEHGVRGDELMRKEQEKDVLHQKLGQAAQERERLRAQMAELLHENDLLHDQIDQLQWHLEQGR